MNNKERKYERNNNKNVAPRHKLESDGNNSRSVSFEGERLSSVSERCPKYVIHRSCWHLGNHRFHYVWEGPGVVRRMMRKEIRERKEGKDK